MGGLNSIAALGANLALGQEAQRRESKQLAREKDRAITNLLERDLERDRQQQLSLRRRIAEQRARAGASGVATTGGSLDAVLRGLERETEEDLQAQKRDTARQIAELRDRFSEKRSRNLLDFSNRLLSSTSGLTSGRRSRSLLG